MVGRNYLKGQLGDRLNAVLVAIGHHLRLIINYLRIIFALIRQWIYKKIYIDTPNDQRWVFISNCSDLHIEQLDTSYPAQMLLVIGQLAANKKRRIRWAFQAD